MSHVILAPQATRGILRCQSFLHAKNPRTARAAGRALKTYLQSLESAPERGRPIAGTRDERELLIPFANAGYIARYRYFSETDRVVIIAVRHQLEAEY